MKFIPILTLFMLCACAPNASSDSNTVKIVEAVVSYPSVEELISQSAPGGLPLKIALTPPHNEALGSNTFGRRVISTNQTDPQALVLGISEDANEAMVTLEYRAARTSGMIHLFNINGEWVVTTHYFWKHRSNNSFKPSPLRGLGAGAMIVSSPRPLRCPA